MPKGQEKIDDIAPVPAPELVRRKRSFVYQRRLTHEWPGLGGERTFKVMSEVAKLQARKRPSNP
jgi:hypothetical protein